MEVLLEYMGKGLITMLMISMPCVLMAAGVGLVVGILQAVTQVQEQTIAAAPKILAVFLVLMIMGVGYVKLLTNLVLEGYAMAFNQIPASENYVLSANYHKYTRPFSSEMQDKINNNSSLNKALINKGAIPWDEKATKRQIYVDAKQTPVVEPNFLERIKIQRGN